MRRLAVLLAGLLLASPLPAAAQVLGTGVTPVVEVGANLYQSTITATQAVLQTINQVWELEPFSELVLGAEYASSLDELSAIITEADGLAYDIQSLQAQVAALFDLDTAPVGSLALRQRMREMRTIVWKSHRYALCAQTLVKTTLSAINHAKALVDQLGGLVGNMQANQIIAQMNANMGDTLAKLQVTTAITQRAETVERMQALLVQHSQERVIEGILADYPGKVPGVGQ